MNLSPDEQQTLASVLGQSEAHDQEHGVAHHGPPILTRREAEICGAMVHWITTVRKQGGYYADFMPSGADICKSRLFWRIRSGKKPLDNPPPTAYSCPWYELIDEPERPHWAYEVHEREGNAYVAQCRYKVIGRAPDGIPSRLSFGPWEFNLSKGPSPYNNGVTGWWIQLAA